MHSQRADDVETKKKKMAAGIVFNAILATNRRTDISKGIAQNVLGPMRFVARAQRQRLHKNTNDVVRCRRRWLLQRQKSSVDVICIFMNIFFFFVFFTTISTNEFKHNDKNGQRHKKKSNGEKCAKNKNKNAVGE